MAGTMQSNLAATVAIRSHVIGESERMLRLQEWEAWYDGLAFEVGPNARTIPWDQEREPDLPNGKLVPLKKRKPYHYNLAAYIVDTPVSWMFGLKHFPAIQVQSETGDATPEEDKADDGNANPTGDWISVLKEALGLESKFLQFGRNGGKTGSAVIVGKIVKGIPCAELLPAKYCEPTFDVDGITLTFLRYQFKAPGSYFAEAMSYQGLEAGKHYWYRREYDANGEYVYQLAEVSADGTPPSFVLDEQRTTKHGLNVMTVTWVRNIEGDDPVDGKPTYWAVTDLFTPVDELLSVAVRSIKRLSDGTIVFTQVDDKSKLEVVQKMGSSSGATMSSPGGVTLLELQGTGQAAALTWMDRLRKAMEIARVVFLDSEKLTAAAQSGYALEILHGPLIELVDELKLTYGPALVRFIRSMLALVVAYTARGGPNGGPGLLVLPRPVEGLPDPKAPITLHWGKFFQPTQQDISQTIANVDTAVSRGYLSRETGMGIVAQLFGVTDLAAERKRIEEERANDPEHGLMMALTQLQDQAPNDKPMPGADRTNEGMDE